MATTQWVGSGLRRFVKDSLLRNSFYLTLNTGTQGAVGFLFWVLNSRLYSASQIGMATTLISGATLISLFSLFGFNTTFIRFLPDSKQRNLEIDTGIVVVLVVGLVLASLYGVVVPLLVPSLGLIHKSIGYTVGFIVLTAFWSVNLVTDSVFIAFRKAQYNVLCDGLIQGALKLSLTAIMVGLGAYGIFMASGLAAAMAVVASIFFMMQAIDYKPKLSISLSVLRRTWHYSAANYAANLLTLSPLLVIPLIVLDVRGPRDAGFYYIAYQLANLLFSIGWAISLSVFAEGSHKGSNLPSLVRRGAKLIALVCVPASILVAVTGHWLLLLFGQAYSANGTSTLAVLALSAPVVALSSTALTVLRITRQLRAVVITSAVYAALTVGLTVPCAKYGLQWVAFAWLLGNTAAGILAAGFALPSVRSRGKKRGEMAEMSR